MSITHEWKVGMTCDGCKGAVERIVKKIDGVEKIEVDVAAKQVLVTGNSAMDVPKITTKLQKWGTAAEKTVEYVGQK